MDKKTEVKVGSRKSELALIQTQQVIDRLQTQQHNISFLIVKLSTIGDKILDTALSKIGEKDLFTRELDDALLDGRVDIVVHSLKDLPTVLPDGTVIGAILRRDDPRDAVVLHPDHRGKTLDTLPPQSVIGTSSLRRTAQLRTAYPHLTFTDIRGNLNTRLKKLDQCEKTGVPYDALVLAAAGLKRMGWDHRISQVLEPETCMYSVGQGALAVQCRRGDVETLALLSSLQNVETTVQCTAERAFLQTLEGGCSVPVAVNTVYTPPTLQMTGGVFSIDGKEQVIVSISVNLESHNDFQIESDNYFSGIAPNAINTALLSASHRAGKALAHAAIDQGAKTIVQKSKDAIAASILNERLIKTQKAILE